MQTIDHTMSHNNLHCLICTYFGATLDLSAAKKYNGSVDNNAVIHKKNVTKNWRKVNYKREVEVDYFLDDETIINDCET